MRGMGLSRIFLISFLLTLGVLAQAQGTDESSKKVARLFERLTGTPLSSRDVRFQQMWELIEAGEDQAAAAIATEDHYFYQVTLKKMSSVMSNKSETPFVPLDDFQATLIGAVRDNLDARTLLTGDYIYRARTDHPDLTELVEPSRRNNQHYEMIDESGVEYRDVLVKQEPQWDGARNHAGLLTTRGWAKAHYDAGTNRRAVQYAFQEFLCLPIDSWKVAGLPDIYVGRDVDRSPGKDPKVFQELCRTCHAGMDAMRGAFSSEDFINEGFVELPPNRPAPKYSRGSTTYPEGYVTRDDSWTNLIADQQPGIGFKKGQTQGKGIQSFGEMLANSEAFKKCMAERVFSIVCKRSSEVRDQAPLKVASRNFEKNGFNLKKLYQEVAVLPSCLGE